MATLRENTKIIKFKLAQDIVYEFDDSSLYYYYLVEELESDIVLGREKEHNPIENYGDGIQYTIDDRFPNSRFIFANVSNNRKYLETIIQLISFHIYQDKLALETLKNIKDPNELDPDGMLPFLDGCLATWGQYEKYVNKSELNNTDYQRFMHSISQTLIRELHHNPNEFVVEICNVKELLENLD